MLGGSLGIGVGDILVLDGELGAGWFLLLVWVIGLGLWDYAVVS